MSKLKKSIIKRYAKLNLKKYGNGTTDLYAGWGSNVDTSQIAAPTAPEVEMDPYQRTPTVTTGNEALAGSRGIANKNKQNGPNYANYAGAALNAYGAYEQASQNPNLNKGQQTAAGVNAAVDVAASSLTPWYALAKTASGVGKSVLDYDENGVAKTSTQRQASNAMTAAHETAINHAGNNDWVAATGTLLSGGLSDNIAETFGLDPNTGRKKGKPSSMQQSPLDYRSYNELHPEFMAKHGMQVPNGYPVIEYEGGEAIFVPKGKGYVKYADPKANKGNQHEQGGIQSPLPEGAVIFSKRFAKKANEAYEANDNLRLKALMQQQDNYNLRKGNPINGTYEQTMRHGGRVGGMPHYNWGTSDLMVMNGEQPLPSNYEMTIPEKKVKNPGMMNYGGRVPRYPFGTGSVGRLEDYGYDPAMFAQNYMGGQAYGAQVGTQGSLDDGSVAISNPPPNTMTGQQLLGGRNAGPSFYNTPAQYTAPAVKTYAMAPEQTTEGTPLPKQARYRQPWNPNIPYGTVAEQALMFAGQNIGNFRDLRESRKWDKVNYGTVNPEYLDPKEAIRAAKDQAAATRYAIREAAGGNAGMYLSNLNAATAQRTKQIADVIADYKNRNAEIGNRSRYYNKDLQVKAQIDEAMNKAKAHDLRRAATAQIGENAAKQYRDYKGGQMNKYLGNLFYQIYPNYPKDQGIPPELINYYNLKK